MSSTSESDSSSSSKQHEPATSRQQPEVLPPLDNFELKLGTKLAERLDQSYDITDSISDTLPTEWYGSQNGIKLLQTSRNKILKQEQIEQTQPSKRPYQTRKLDLANAECPLTKREKLEQAVIHFRWRE